MVCSAITACSGVDGRGVRPVHGRGIGESPATRAGAGPAAEQAGVVDTDAGAPVEARSGGADDLEAPQGRACTTSSDCAAGERCRGPAGCTAAWACGDSADCSGAVVAYCDCDGATFYAPEGCPGRPYASRGACGRGDEAAAAAEPGVYDADHRPGMDRRACTSSAECGGGRVCWGVPGCGGAWTCVRARGCTRDEVPFCGCDGVTFVASSTCPGRPFAHRGPCHVEGAAVASRGATPARRDAAAPGSPTPPVGPVTSAPATPPMHATSASTTSESASAMASAPTGGATSRPPGSCRSNRDCARGLVCTGQEGCDDAPVWTCQPPARACIADTQVFCGCDGRDFRASMTCPGRPHRHRGSCAIDRLLELQGSALR
jgi:hypothetical protein